MAQKKPFNQFLLILLILLMVVCGTINSCGQKIMMKMESKGDKFEQHKFIICSLMFIGELFSLCPYFIKYYSKKKKNDNLSKIEKALGKEDDIDRDLTEEEKEEEEEDGTKIEAPFYIFSITAMCDLVASTLGTFALIFLATSIYQIFRALELMFVLIFSKVFLKNPIYRHHVLGIGTLILGLFLVGLSSILFQGEASTHPIRGISILCFSQIVSATQYTLQEYFLKKYTFNPFKLVGFEGFFGISIYSILLTIFQHINCENWGSLKVVCFEKKSGDKSILLENAIFAFQQIFSKTSLLILVFIYITSIAAYNIIGINLTKLVSSTARAIVDTTRTFLIWIVFLTPFAPKEAKEHFNFLQLTGFILTVTGMIIYNEIIEISLFDLNYYTRKEIAKRESLTEQIEEIEKNKKDKTNDNTQGLFDNSNLDNETGGDN
jgi:drug/metabolite transporter (DMT)-like permease